MRNRLRVAERDYLLSKMMKHAFQKRVLELISEQSAFALEVYEDCIPVALRTKLAALPAGWVPETDSISVQFGSSGRRYTRLDFDGRANVYGVLSQALDHSTSRDDPRRRIPFVMKDSTLKVYKDSDVLSVRAAALAAKADKITAEINVARRQAKAALTSFSTVSSLLKGWPEVKPFLGDIVGADVVQLPAINRPEMNKLLALPVEELAC